MTDHTIKSGDIQGKHVLGQGGAKLGTTREVFIDLGAGKIEFVIVEASSFLGGSGKFHPVPWPAVRYNPGIDAFQLDMGKDEFKASPSYDRDQLANESYGWGEQCERYFLQHSTMPNAPDLAAAH